MQTLSIPAAFRNLRLQHRKLGRGVLPHSFNPDLLHAWERPTSMAWRMVWALLNRPVRTGQERPVADLHPVIRVAGRPSQHRYLVAIPLGTHHQGHINRIGSLQ